MSQLTPEPLTPREAKVLELLKSGLPNKLIARAISISEQTVKYHLKNLYLKLGAQGRAHAVALASQIEAERPATVPRVTAEERRRIETPLSPLAFARRTRKLYPDREAVVDGQRRLSYAQLFDRCDRWSAAMSTLGMGRGDRVATIAPSTLHHLEQFYAVPQLGAVIVPINFRLLADDFAYLIHHSGAKMVCAVPEYFDLIDGLRAVLPEVQHYVALEGAREGWLDYEALIAQSDGVFPQAPIDEHALLSINYTSGTSYRPRGAMITHRGAWTNAIGTLLHWPLQAQDRYLWTLPMFHANGWGMVWTVTAAGAAHVCVRDTATTALVELVAREKVTALCAGKTALIAIANCPDALRPRLPRGVRVLTAGASPAVATIERVERELGWDVSHVYGLSETSPFVAVCDTQHLPAGATPAQRARFKVRQGVELLTSGELRVVDEEGLDVPADGASLGEIVLRGPVVMQGYYRDDEESARVFAGGWFHTGDAAVVHADGFIEIRDRFKDIIISGDEIVSSIEVEDVLMRHPAVFEVAVVGRAHAELGESAHAYVVARSGARTSEQELRQFAQESLAAFKVPTRIHCVSSLPKTATGKVLKHQLRAADRAAG